MQRRHLLAACAALGALPLPLAAQTWPAKPVMVVQGFAPGGNADTIARILGAELSQQLGQPIVVESKAGAGGTIAAGTVARAPADGYTLLLATGAHAIAAALYDKLPYDTDKAFEPVSALTSFPFLVVVNKDSKFANLGDLLAQARAKPEKLNFGSAGVGTGQHMTGELLGVGAGVKLTHVPYRGESAALTAVLGNETDFVLVAPTSVIGHIKTGKLRALATSGAARWPGLPEVPTVAEQGVAGFDVRSWTALLAPAATPPAVVSRLNAAVQAALKKDAVRTKLEEATGGDIRGSTPDELRAAIRADIQRWNKLVAVAHIAKQ
jgi:tripartite-type tricarboxylate transporter receptor subunit TctC